MPPFCSLSRVFGGLERSDGPLVLMAKSLCYDAVIAA